MKLKRLLKNKAGRNKGQVSVRHQGGRMKRFLREIDFKRSKIDLWGKIEKIEYDPNRNCDIALVVYEDGQRSYIIAPNGLVLGQKIISSSEAPIEIGNTLPLSKIPVGTQVHNLEINQGKGGQIARGAGSVAFVFGRDEKNVLIKMPSGEIRKFDPNCRATIGQVGNIDKKHQKLRKAGTNRRKGIRPSVRGVAMHPDAHPHGGGEGRSGVGLKYPKTPWGKPAVGRTRKHKKYSDRLIIEERKRGKK